MLAIEDRNSWSNFKKAAMPWLICFAATLFFFYEFIQGNMMASLLDFIMRDFNIKANQISWLTSIYYVSNVLFLFVSGMVLDRFSIKRVILLAMSLCVISTFVFSWSNSFYLSLVCRFITGIGSAFCFLGPVRLAAQWFPPQRMALVTGAIVTMAMTGGWAAQYPLTLLVEQVGWREAVHDVGMLGVAMLIMMALWIKEKPRQKHQSGEQQHQSILKTAKTVYFNPLFLRAAAYTSLMNMTIAVFGAMMGIAYLKKRMLIGAEPAALVNSFLFFGAIVGGPVLGAISDKTGQRLKPMKIGAVLSLIVAVMAFYLPVPFSMMLVLFFLLGFFTSSQVISYALVAENSPPAITATAVGVISILTQGGYFLYQNLFTLLLEHFNGTGAETAATQDYSLAAYQQASIILPIGLFVALMVILNLKDKPHRSKDR